MADCRDGGGKRGMAHRGKIFYNPPQRYCFFPRYANKILILQ